MNKQKFVLVFVSLCIVRLGFAQQNIQTFSLNEAINYALKNNFNAKAAANNLIVAKQKKWETTTIGLPQVNAKIDYQQWLKQQITLLPAEITGGDAGTFVPVTFGTEQNVNASITLNQLIFDGSYLVGLQSAKTYLKISELAQEKTDFSIKESVINAYGNVLIAEKSIEILEGNLSVLEKNLNDTEQIFKNGFTEEEDVEQLKITLTTLKSLLSKTKRLKEIGYKMLNLSLGNEIDTKINLSDSLESLMSNSIDMRLMSSVLELNNHIDYQIAENDKESKSLLVKLEKSKALPSVAAFVNFGYTGNSNEFTFLDKSQQWFDSSLFGVSLKIPIFSSFQRASKTKQAQIELENADLRLKETAKQVNLQVASAKSNYQYSIEQYEAAKNNLALAERIEKKHRVKFFEGVSTSFDLSQAQNQLYTQQQNFVQSMMDVIAKKAILENALSLPIK